MRLTLLIALTMCAFAANSLLNRAAVGEGHIDAMSFAQIRLLAGAGVLAALCRLRGLPLRQERRMSLLGSASLTIYMIGFSLAYQSLDAGIGALILFGAVQIAMFGWGAATGGRVTTGQVLGAAVAFAGLAYVVWPAGTLQVPPAGAALMAAAGLGWAAYSLAGRQAREPLQATAVNFLWSSAMTLPVLLALGGGLVTVPGAVLAAVSGTLTSGLGYALWYRVLPQISAPVAATVQLSVPVIAILAGAALLGEAVGLRLALGAAAVLGGIALVIRAAPRAAKA
ncbi:DMT family transporter [Roseobacteraceae bacterium NS-SX3]